MPAAPKHSAGRTWWTWWDSNPQPTRCKRVALANWSYKPIYCKILRVLITYYLPRHSWVGRQSHTTSVSPVSLCLGRTSIKSIKLHILLYTEFFSHSYGRIVRQVQHLNNQKTVFLLLSSIYILCATRRALTGAYSPYPMWVSISHIESLSVTFEQGKVNITFSLD